MRKKVCVVTATRAEYGLLKPFILKLKNIEQFDIQVVVTGAHLSPAYGLTYKEIEDDNIVINKKIEILLGSDTAIAVSKAMGLALIGFSEYFEENRPDILLILGDRYEMLAAACAAANAGIPIAHLYGGETTEGAIDESIRHAITKLSYLHFTSTIEYRKRVIQLGESPDRVFSVGAIGIENAMCTELYSKTDLEESLDWNLDRPFAIVTFHPVTMERGMAIGQVNELLKALDTFPEMKFIITKANADSEGLSINKIIEDYEHDHTNVKVYDSLGTKRYLSTLKYAVMVIGNSSSGLIEAPSFLIPTINIGNRQKGRLQAESVINCDAICDCIVIAVKRAMSREFREKIRCVHNPYGDGDTSEKVVEIIKKYLEQENRNLMKKFYDL